MTQGLPTAVEPGTRSGGRLSYKYQRLREQIRQAIERGELRGQLPGERVLGRRFNANAKTINKALCDLSGEGLLVRVIGRGTFVADSNGQLPDAERALVFHLIAPIAPHAAGHRAALAEAIESSLRDAGHGMAFFDWNGRNGASSIPAEAWPLQMRRAASGLLVHPFEPLGENLGRPSSSLIAEAWRRQIPLVSLCAAADSAKINAVVPDYVGAGFMLADQFFLMGCRRLYVVHGKVPSPETEMILSGCQTAALRHQKSVMPRVGAGPRELVGELTSGTAPSNNGKNRVSPAGTPETALLFVGSAELNAFMGEATARALVAKGGVAVGAVVEPGASASVPSGVSTVEFDLRTIADWAMRLLTEYKPGQRPIEVLVSGRLRIGATSEAGEASNGRFDGAGGPSDASHVATRLSDAVV